MNSKTHTPARRRFLKNLAITGGALALGPTAALACAGDRRRRYPCWHAKRFRFEARGRGRFTDVVGFYWPFPAPPWEMAFASYEVWMKFPYENCDLLRLQVTLLPPLAPEPVVISDSVAEIEEITVGPPVAYPSDAGDPILPTPKPTFGMMGRIVENAVPSPFGPMVGKTALFGAAFDREGDDVNFYLLGGMVCGQHATFLRPFQEVENGPYEHARGSIHFHGYR